MKKQAKEFGCKIKSNIRIKEYKLSGPVKKVALEDGRAFSAKTVILAPGGKPRPLNIPGEEEFKGKGISYCAVDGVFVFVGYIPNTNAFKDLIKLNDRLEILVDEDKQTSTPGVYAAGDYIPKKYRQVTTAVADGTIAALSASAFLRENC